MWYKFIKCFLIKWVYYICNIFILFYGWFFNVYVQVIWPALVNRPFLDGLWIVRSWTDFCKGRCDLFFKSDADRAKLNWSVLCNLSQRGGRASQARTPPPASPCRTFTPESHPRHCLNFRSDELAYLPGICVYIFSVVLLGIIRFLSWLLQFAVCAWPGLLHYNLTILYK